MPFSRKTFTPSIIALITVNLLPLIGVLFWEWDVAMIILLYWVENLLIGFYNILKMLFVQVPAPIQHLGKLFIIPFFCIHYGGFCAGHGFFLLFFFGMSENMDAMMQNISWPGPLIFLQLLVGVVMALWENHPEGMGWLVTGLFLSHGISFVQHYIVGKEYATITEKELMGQPYARIVVMHIAIIFGGGALMALGSPVPLLCILILLKIGMDITLHIRQHTKKEEEKEETVKAISEGG